MATERAYIEAGGFFHGSYTRQRLRAAAPLTSRRSRGERDVVREAAAAATQGGEYMVAHHRLGVRGLEALAAFLGNGGGAGQEQPPLPSLRSVVLRDNGLCAASAAALGEQLLRNRELSELSVQQNPDLGDGGAVALIHGLSAGTPSQLTRLRLEDAGLSSTAVRALAAALDPAAAQPLGQLTSLSLRGNALGVGAAEPLAQVLRRGGSRLASLELGSCGLKALGLARLAAALPHNASVTELRLARNVRPTCRASLPAPTRPAPHHRAPSSSHLPNRGVLVGGGGAVGRRASPRPGRSRWRRRSTPERRGRCACSTSAPTPSVPPHAPPPALVLELVFVGCELPYATVLCAYVLIAELRSATEPPGQGPRGCWGTQAARRGRRWPGYSAP